MSYNKAQFQVAFNPSDLIDNLKSAQIAAYRRDKTIAGLNKMSELNNPWAKLTAYSALGRFAQQYQHEKIQALGGTGIDEMQKQYMRQMGHYLEQKNAYAKTEADIVGRIKEADIYSIPVEASGGMNLEEAFGGGMGGGYMVEQVEPEYEDLISEYGSRLAGMQAEQERGYGYGFDDPREAAGIASRRVMAGILGDVYSRVEKAREGPLLGASRLLAGIVGDVASRFPTQSIPEEGGGFSLLEPSPIPVTQGGGAVSARGGGAVRPPGRPPGTPQSEETKEKTALTKLMTSMLKRVEAEETSAPSSSFERLREPEIPETKVKGGKAGKGGGKRRYYKQKGGGAAAQ